MEQWNAGRSVIIYFLSAKAHGVESRLDSKPGGHEVLRFSGQTHAFISNCSTSMGEQRLTLRCRVSNCLGLKAAIPTAGTYTLLSFPTGTSPSGKTFLPRLLAQQANHK
jgi:hypothetical protein